MLQFQLLVFALTAVLFVAVTAQLEEYVYERVRFPPCPRGAQAMKTSSGLLQKCLPFSEHLCNSALSQLQKLENETPCCWFNHIDYYCCLGVPQPTCPSYSTEITGLAAQKRLENINWLPPKDVETPKPETTTPPPFIQTRPQIIQKSQEPSESPSPPPAPAAPAQENNPKPSKPREPNNFKLRKANPLELRAAAIKEQQSLLTIDDPLQLLDRGYHPELVEDVSRILREMLSGIREQRRTRLTPVYQPRLIVQSRRRIPKQQASTAMEEARTFVNKFPKGRSGRRNRFRNRGRDSGRSRVKPRIEGFPWHWLQLGLSPRKL